MNQPLQVEFEVDGIGKPVKPEGRPSYVLPPDYWTGTVETIMDQFPDMEISDVVLERDTITFKAKFKHRDTTSNDLEWRLYDFLRYTPTMKLNRLTIKP